MSHHRLLACLFAIAACAPQAMSQTLSVCAGVNHLTTASQALTVPAGTRVGVLFVPAQPIQVSTVEFYFPSTVNGGTININTGVGTFEIRANDSNTNLPSTVILASGIVTSAGGGVISATSGWRGPTFAAPVLLYANQPYWLTHTRSPSTGASIVGVQNSPAGPDVTPASYEALGIWSSTTVVDRFKVRLRAVNCTPPGPVASWTPVGVGCTGVGGTPPALTSYGLPVFGNANNGLVISGGTPFAGYALFISYSADPIGTPLGAGCSMYLELNGFLSLQAAGLNPLVLGALDAGGSVVIPLPVPNNLGLSGAILAFEAAVAASSGIPAGSGFFHLTQAQVGTIGI